MEEETKETIEESCDIDENNISKDIQDLIKEHGHKKENTSLKYISYMIAVLVLFLTIIVLGISSRQHKNNDTDPTSRVETVNMEKVKVVLATQNNIEDIDRLVKYYTDFKTDAERAAFLEGLYGIDIEKQQGYSEYESILKYLLGLNKEPESP